MEPIILTILIIILIFIISALPLYFAVNILGGRTSILKTLFVMFITGLLTAAITTILPFGGVIAFIVLIWIYHEMFRLKWWKSFVAWFLQLIFIWLLIALFATLGIGFITFKTFF